MSEIRINNVLYSTPIQKVTQAEYDALGDAKNTNGVLYAITDGKSGSGSVGKPVELTKAQYEALGDSVLNDNILYAITDGDDYTAKNLAYDDSETQLGVNNVQDAISEQNKKIPNIKSGIFTSNVVLDKGVEQKFTITFDEPFESTPVVVCNTMNDAFIVQLYKEEVTKNGFSIYAYNAKTVSNTFLGVHWIAVSN